MSDREWKGRRTKLKARGSDSADEGVAGDIEDAGETDEAGEFCVN